MALEKGFDKKLTPDFGARAVCAKGLFGGGGGGGDPAAMMQLAQEQAQMRNLQGQQLAALSKQQGQADAETASLMKPGLGRALLAYRKDTSASLGG